MKCLVEELSDSEDWGKHNVKASRVLGPQVPEVIKKRRLVKAFSASPHEARDVDDTGARPYQEQRSRTALPESLDSFAFTPNSGVRKAKAGWNMWTNSSPKCSKEERGSGFVKECISSRAAKLDGNQRDQAGHTWRQNGKSTQAVREEDGSLSASTNPKGGFVRSSISAGKLHIKIIPPRRRDVPSDGKAQPIVTSPEPQGNLRAKRKVRRHRVVDDSSDEDYVYNVEKREKISHVYGSGLEMDNNSGDDGTIARQLEDDEDEEERAATTSDDSEASEQKPGARKVDGKDPLKKTLQKCDQIATALRKKLHINSSTEGAIADDRYTEVDASSAKVVTQADVYAACSMDPSNSRQSLTSYQLVGVNFLLLLHRQKVGGAILADEMGLGKTVQAVVYLAVLKQLDHDQGPHLVVAPASLLENWQRELNKWCPSFSVLLYHGNERISRCRELLDLAKSGGKPPFNVMLTCYSLFERDSAQQKYDRRLMKGWRWSCVLMDEAHLLKDRGSLRSKHLWSVAQGAQQRLMLTGTPLQNDLQELWSLLEFMMPETFDTGNADLSKLLGDRKSMANGTLQNVDLIAHIKSILGPFVLRRLKSDVMRQLVPKIQKVELLQMLEGQAAAYGEVVDNYRKVVAARGPRSSKAGSTNIVNSLPRRQVNSIFTELRKLANHPLLSRRIFNDNAVQRMAKKFHQLGVFGNECTVERVREELSTYSDYSLHKMCVSYGDGPGYGKLDNKYALSSAKCQAMAKLLPELQQHGHRPLIFSQWTGMLDILEWALDIMGFSHVRLDGSTPVSERQTLVDSYNNCTDTFAFLLSTRAGGQGLNLTGADTVILHDVDFNPQVDRQAEDRCHRIGQTKPVTVYRLVTKSTVDENIFEIAKRKLVLDAAVLETKVTDEVESNCQNNIRNMADILASILDVAS